MFDKLSVFQNHQDFLLNIHKNKEEKLFEFFRLINHEKVDISDYDNLKKITHLVMNQLKKSDDNFLSWLYFCGEHINLKFNCKWALMKYNFINKEWYSPILINEKNDIWNIGQDCERLYYKYNRLYNIEFSTFYKMSIERLLSKNKLGDIEQNGLIDFIELK
ncbi:hypothetical protein L3X37_08495 [Sabulilitoribacter arenilitoris]|uniref:Uncharacterized protein n=1 Tax=Wocania arenilitoris TaxID=2044858 RepID=A0AAE3JLN5_9FLAO|nr:hypothetical protein [Wocania arenilitoris]MCF7568402.1 hypothetical protein [Wocania arenilitoris]